MSRRNARAGDAGSHTSERKARAPGRAGREAGEAGKVEQLAIFTMELFATPHDEANRAAVAPVATEDLDLVGIALRAERKTVDKVVDRLARHP